MKKSIVVASSVVVLILLLFRLLNKHQDELHKEREWYLNNLDYNLSGIIDSVKMENSPNGIIYFHATSGKFDSNTETLLKQKLKRHAVLFLLKENSLGAMEMASEHADQFLEKDSIIINSNKNEIISYRNNSKFSSADLLTSLRGGEY